MKADGISRRQAMRAGAAMAVAGVIGSSGGEAIAQVAGTQPATQDRLHGLKIGVATYTFRKKSLDETIAGINRVGLKYCSIKDAHLPLKSTAEERKAVSEKFRAAGIVPLSCGNITMRNEGEARQAFEYARDAGIPTIVCAPVYDVLPVLDRLVKEFDIRLAIHNHGPEDKWFASPYDVWKRVESLDRRVGLCVDVGHTRRAGVEPQEAIQRCGERVYDCHLKDIESTDPHAKVIEVGRGVLNIPAILRSLIAIKMQGHVGFEHEKDPNDPLPGLAESVGYVRGVLAMM